DEAAHWFPHDQSVRQFHRPRGANEPERCPREHARVGRDRAAWRERDAEASYRRAGTHAEEDIGFVVPEHACPLLWMLGEPLAQRAHRHGFLRDLAFLDEEPSDAPVPTAVRRGRPYPELAIA